MFRRSRCLGPGHAELLSRGAKPFNCALNRVARATLDLLRGRIGGGGGGRADPPRPGAIAVAPGPALSSTIIPSRQRILRAAGLLTRRMTAEGRRNIAPRPHTSCGNQAFRQHGNPSSPAIRALVFHANPARLAWSPAVVGRQCDRVLLHRIRSISEKRVRRLNDLRARDDVGALNGRGGSVPAVGGRS
jgi:hypothetical protein